MTETLQQVLAELPDILERAQNATAGPWQVERKDEVLDANGDFVALAIYRDDHNVPANAEFIAHAREDVSKMSVALQAAADEINWRDRLLDFIESYSGGGSREQEGIGLSAANIAEMVKRAREGGKRG